MKKLIYCLSFLILPNLLSATNYYWVGGTGAWSDYANHWATSSGGTVFHVTIPTPADDVFFDANSFPANGDTLNLDTTIMRCRSMDWSGVLNSPRIQGYVIWQIYGSLAMNANISWDNFGSNIRFRSGSAGNMIITHGQELGEVYFEGPGGGWTLGDDFACENLHVEEGVFNSNNYGITCRSLYAVNSPVFLLGSSEIYVGQTAFLSAPGLTMDADSASFVCGGDGSFQAGSQVIHRLQLMSYPTTFSLSTTAAEFGELVAQSSILLMGSGTQYHKAVFLDDVELRGNNVFDTLVFNNPGNTVTLDDAGTQTILDEMQANGTCAASIAFQSKTPGAQALMSKSSGTVTCSYLTLKDVHASGGASFIANSSLDMGNNAGWVINTTPARNLYWVGGSGIWNSSGHWSLTSGGVGGNCAPTAVDNVYIDSNSFPQAADTLYMSGISAYCKNLDFSGVLHVPDISCISSTIYIYGSITLAAGLVWEGWNSYIRFRSGSAGNMIITHGQELGEVYFEGPGGGWTLGDDFACENLHVEEGVFNSNNYGITCRSLYAVNSPVFLLGSSEIYVGQTAFLSAPGLTMDADSASFVCGGDGSFQAGSQVIHRLQLMSYPTTFSLSTTAAEFGELVAQSSILLMGSGTQYHKAVFLDDVELRGNNVFDTLLFNNPGNTTTLNNSSITTVNNHVQFSGNPGFPTTVQCTNGSAILFKPTDTVCADYLYLQNILATGGATYYAGDHSVDLGGNSGWNWTSCVPLISNVWPGDCNYDLITDNFDLLNIGVAMGDTGFVRPAASLTYVAQPCQDWYWQFINAVNVKHADCDGNGTVEAADTTAISLNYGLTHPARPAGSNQSTSTGTDLILQLPATAVAPGSVISAPIYLGTSGNLANNIYGMAFTIDYDSAYIQPGTMNIDYTGSWVAGAGNYLHIEKDFPSDGKLDMAFTRYNHTDISGYGLIGTLNFTVSNTATGLLGMSFSKVKIISHNEIEVPVVTQSTSLTVNVNEITNSTSVSLYPNPARNELFLTTGPLNGRKAIIIVTDMLGQVMMQTEKATDQNGRLSAELQLAILSNGIYFLRIETDKESLVERFVKE